MGIRTYKNNLPDFVWAGLGLGSRLLVLGQSEREQCPAQQSGHDGAAEDAELGIVEQGASGRADMVVGKVGDEHGYRETNARQHTCAEEHLPVTALGQLYEAQSDRQPGEGEDAGEFPDSETEKDGQPHSVEQAVETDALQVDSCVGEGEDGYDDVVDRILQGVLQRLQGADVAVGCMLDVFQQHDLFVGEDGRSSTVGGGLVERKTVDFVPKVSHEMQGRGTRAGRYEEGHDDTGYGGMDA